MKSTLIKATLWVGIILLAYFGLYGNITNEIQVREQMDKRKSENIQRLKDLREIQLEYKRQKGHYTNSPDSLTDFLFNTNIEFVNSEKAEEDSIPSDMGKWKSIQRRLLKDKIDPKAEAKRIYAEMGGEWTTLSESQKISKGYISVSYYKAHELAFDTKHNSTRNNSFKINVATLSNISELYKNQKNYTSFNSDFNSYASDLQSKIDLKETHISIKNNFNFIFDLDTNTKISTSSLESSIKTNKKEIASLKSVISEEKEKISNAEGLIRAAQNQRATYTETIGDELIAKVKGKAKEKEAKGKKLKGRKGIIYSIINSQDSTENVNTTIVNTCNKNISDSETEIEARNLLITVLEKNIQAIKDVNSMQEFAFTQNKQTSNFDSLSYFTINEEIKIVTTLKKGNYTTPTLPKEWKKAQLKADFLVEQSMDAEMLERVNQSYLNSGGKWRDLTEEEGFARGLITVTIRNVSEVIFDEIYMKNRTEGIELDLDELTEIPHTNLTYTFEAKETHPNLMEQAQGEIDRYYFVISASYDDVFSGMDEEQKILRRNGERELIQVGSLDKTITNGNWGE
jgi:hypothetical protein